MFRFAGASPSGPEPALSPTVAAQADVTRHDHLDAATQAQKG
jgi:hypothetical protein